MITNREDWTLLKLGMAKRQRELSAKTEAYMEDRAFDLLRQLKHDTDCCGDPKSFYEKELPYRMESAARADLRNLTEIITREFTNNLYWLQNNLRNFGVTSFDLPFMNQTLKSEDHVQESLNLIDIHKSKLYTRVGTLITAICLAEFGIAVFIGSLFFGVTAEEVFLSRSNRSKEQIKAILPDIVENYKTQMKLHILEALAEPQSQIVKSLNTINHEQGRLQ